MLAALVVVGAALSGWAATEVARRRAAALRALLEDAKVLRVQMVSMFEPVPLSLSRARSPLLREVGAAMEGGLSAGEAWKRVRGRRAGALSNADREVLDGLFAHLGESGRERQELLLSSAAERLRLLLDEAADRAKRAERLYGTLGLLLGLLLAVLVI